VPPSYQNSRAARRSASFRVGGHDSGQKELQETLRRTLKGWLR